MAKSASIPLNKVLKDESFWLVIQTGLDLRDEEDCIEDTIPQTGLPNVQAKNGDHILR